VEIRPLREGDAAAIHLTLLGDPEIAAWYRSTGPFSRAECEEMVTRKVAHREAHGFGWSLGWDGVECVGWGTLQYCIVDGVTEVEIGWAVARSRWRQGLAIRMAGHLLTELRTALTARGLELDTIVAYARADNVASRGVMVKLGMAYEKDFAFDGEPHVLYRLPLA
jgi:ribosomal-protein-alanine N-acetyltransferase